MCAHYTLFSEDDIRELENIIREVEQKLDEPQQMEIWPGYTAPILVPTQGNALEVKPMKWGFHGFNTKKPIQNTKYENAFSSNFWRNSFEERRCLIPVAGFDEWQHYDDARPQQFTFFVPGALLYIAGIWRQYHSEELPHFSMLTTEPNSSVKEVHNRMPLVLGTRREDIEVHQWLFGDYQAMGDCEHISLQKKPAKP